MKIERTPIIWDKLARRLIPFLFMLYMVAFIDRVNVGFAKLQMSADLGLDEAAYGVGAGIFFLGYFLLEVPSNLILHRIGARIWISRIVILWGLVSMAMAFVGSQRSFYVLRFLLGMSEAGFFPGIILYLTYWFPSRQRARTTAAFMTALAVSGIIGGPLSGWIMDDMDGQLTLRGWQWLFLVEGAPAVVLGFVCFRFLDDTPELAGWLSAVEKQEIRASLLADSPQRHGTDSLHSFWLCIGGLRLWMLAVVYFLLGMGIYGVSFWLPQIIHDLEQGGFLMTGLLSAIPYLFAAVAMITVGHSSDVRQERCWHISFSALCACAGLVLTANFVHSPLFAMIGLTLATAGIFAALGTFWSLPTAFLSGTAAAGGIALINSIAALGGYFGPAILGWARQASGSLSSGLYALAAAQGLSAVLVVILTRNPAYRQRNPSL